MSSRRARRAGFTLIEVMVSLGVMMVGAMAVISLQQHSIRSNAHARNMTTAMQIAQRWMERLKEDGHHWTAIGTDASSVSSALTNTVFLKADLTGMTAQPGEFKPLPITAPATWELSNAFDQDGRDMPTNLPQSARSVHTFCASYRPAWIWYGHLMRMDVRVWWARDVTRPDGTRPIITTDFATPQVCGSDDVKLRPGGTQYDWYHVVYLPGAIRVSEVRR